MRRGDSDLVDPEFGRLVGVDVVDRRSHAHHAVIVDRHREVVSGVGLDKAWSSSDFLREGGEFWSREKG